jgi:hypothetical protein
MGATEARGRWFWGDRRLWSLKRACAGQPQRRVDNRVGVYGGLIMSDKGGSFRACGWLRSSCEVSSWVMETEKARRRGGSAGLEKAGGPRSLVAQNRSNSISSPMAPGDRW